MPAADEQQLVLQVKQGSREAFRCLVERHMKHVYNVAYGFVHDHHDAEEVAQEAFVRAYRSMSTFRGEAEIGTWLYRIAMNLALNRIKQRRHHAARIVHTEEDMADPATTEHDTSHHGDVQGHIEHALHELPTLQRAVVILRHLDGLSTRQVSGILRCSEGTVKTHLHRGLKKLKSKLDFLKADGL